MMDDSISTNYISLMDCISYAPLWLISCFIWKVLISVFYVLYVHNDNAMFGTICILMAIFGIWVYFATSIYLFYFIHIENNGKQPYFKRDTDEYVLPSLIFSSAARYVSKAESKYKLIQYLLFFIGYTLISILYIISLCNVDTNGSIFYLLSSIPIFLSIILFEILNGYAAIIHLGYGYLFFVTVISFISIWILFCLILQNDFNLEINSLYITIPIIMFIMIGEVIYNIILYRGLQHLFFLIICVSCIPGCCQFVAWIAFTVLWIMFYINSAPLIIYTFIPIWCCWGLQCFQILLITCNLYGSPQKKHILKQKYGEEIVLSLLDTEQLNELNKALQYKRDTDIGDDRMIILNNEPHKTEPKTHGNTECDDLKDECNETPYRVRSENFVSDIISPNHVALDINSYTVYTSDDNDIHKILNYSQQDYYAGINAEQYEEYIEKGFYQWIPTEFRVEFVNDIKCLTSKDMKDEYVDIKLNSLYIPDINQFKYKNLNEIILNILKTKIIPGFVSCITKDKTKKSDNYKKLLFDWCSTKKILKIIVKSEQCEFSEENRNSPKEISNGYHIDGTLIEKISHIAIVYTSIDPYIIGGDLHLSFQDNMDNVWRYKPKTSSIIIFPNMHHKVAPMTLKKINIKTKRIRRILTFFLCSKEYFINTLAFKAFTNYDQEFNENTIMRLPLLTANNLFPLDKQHCYQLLNHLLIQQCSMYNIPKPIILIIQQYILNDNLLRDDVAMETTACNLREYRRFWVNYEYPHRPMMCN